MKKTAIILLTVLIAGMFVACNQDVTVDAQVHANIELGTFVLDGKNYATLQEAVNAKLGKGLSKALGDTDGVIYLTRNASGPGAVIDKLVDGGVIIDFAGYTYSFTNVTGLQGGDNPKAETFGLGITGGADVTLKGLQQIDLNDTTTTDLTMVYVAGKDTKLTIEDAPKMKVEDDQYVFWAADGATLTIGSTTTTSEKTEITGKIAATGTSESKPVVSFNNDTKINASELKADAAVVVINTSEDSSIGSFVGANDANIVVSGAGDVTVTKNDSESTATYTIENTSSTTPEESATVIVPTTEGDSRSIDSGEKVDGDSAPEEDPNPSVAMIGSTLYKTLYNGSTGAIDKALSGDTVILLKNIVANDTDLEKPIIIKKDITLDLGNHSYTRTVSDSTNNYRIIKVSDANVTIKDGELHADSSDTSSHEGNVVFGTIRAEGTAVVNLENCALYNNHDWGLSIKINSKDAVVIMNDCYVESATTGGGGIEVAKGKAEIYDCKFVQKATSTNYIESSVAVSYGGVCNVISADFSSKAPYSVFVYSSGGTINFESGTCVGLSGSIGIDSTCWGEDKAVADSIVNISDGSFTGNILINHTIPGSGTDDDFGAYLNISGGDFSYGSITNNNGEISITGGTFNHDPSSYVVEGYEAKDNGDGTWTVVEKDPVAMIGEVKYFTLQSAVDAVKEGETIVVLKDISVSSKLDITKSFVLSLNGHTITGTENAKDSKIFNVTSGTLTIDGTTANSSINAKAIAVYVKEDAKLNVKGGVYSNTFYEPDAYGGKGSYIFDVQGTAEINGVTFGSVVKGIRSEGAKASVTVSNSTATVEPYFCLFGAADEGSLTIKSGTYSTSYSDVKYHQMIDIKKNGSVTINGGNFTTSYSGTAVVPALVVFNGGNTSTGVGDRLVINGGEFTYAGKLGYINGSMHEVISITDGTFNVSSVVVDNGKTGNVLEYAITGGTFLTDPSAYVASGYIAIAQVTEPETWVVSQEPMQVRITKDDNSEDPVEMTLAAFRDSVNGGNTYSGYTATLLDGVNLNGSDSNQWIPIGTEQHPFKGLFNGGNHSITNLYMNNTTDGKDYALFGVVEDAIIKNLTVSGTIVAKKTAAGIVAKACGNTTITNVINNVNVSANDKVGGIICSAYPSYTYDTANNNNVNAISADRVITLKECVNTGNITCLGGVTKDTHMIAGAIVGYAGQFGRLVCEDCENEGTIKSVYSNPNNVSNLGSNVSSLVVGWCANNVNVDDSASENKNGCYITACTNTGTDNLITIGQSQTEETATKRSDIVVGYAAGCGGTGAKIYKVYYRLSSSEDFSVVYYATAVYPGLFSN